MCEGRFRNLRRFILRHTEKIIMRKITLLNARKFWLSLTAIATISTLGAQTDDISDTTKVDEVVVTALGIKKDKKKLGFAVQEFSGSALTKAKEPNVVNSMVGRVAGLTIGQSAEILGAPSIVLRGSDPRRGQSVLFVVDGIPVNSDAYNLAPDDIDKVTVLKGPAAAALYGYRGQNGAIVITTKKGTQKGVQVEFNSSNMLESGFLTIPKVQDQYGPGDHGKYSFTDGKGGGLNDGDYDVWGPKFENQLISQYDSPVDPVTGVRSATPWTNRGKDNLSRFLQTGLVTNNNFSISTSSEKADVRFSFSNMHQVGQVPNTSLTSQTFNISNTIRFNDKLRLDANINYNRQSTPNISDVNYGPNSMIYNIIIWGGADWDIMSDDIRGIWQKGKEGVQSVFAEYQRYHNPWFMAEKWLRGHYKNDVYGYTSLNYQITPALNLMARTSASTYDLLRTEKMPFSAHPYGREEGRGDYREDRRSMFEMNNEFLISYKKDLSLFNVDASFGGNRRDFQYTSSFATTDYLNVPEVYSFANSANPVKVSNFNANMAVSSLFGLVDIGGNGYNLNLAARMDNLSTMPENASSYVYPSASLAVIPTEIFTKLKSKNLGFWKLRASIAEVKGGLTNPTIGIVGNPLGYGSDYSSPYNGPSYTNSSVYSTPLAYNNKPSANFTNTLSNASLQPFSRTNIEVGTEARILNNKIGIEATYFIYNDGPGIFQRSISEATGYTNQLVNGIETQRRGWELTINADIIKAKKAGDLEWSTSANFSGYGEYLTKVYDGVDQLASNFFLGDNRNDRVLKVGDRIDGIYASAFARRSNGDIINDAGGRPVVLAKGKFLGNSLPDMVWGLFNNVKYKNFNLSFQFDGRVGGKIVNQIQRQTYRGGRNIETVENNIKDANGLGMGDARYQDYLGNKSWVGEGVQITSGTPKYDDNGTLLNESELTFADNSTKTYLQDYVSRYYGQYEANIMDKSYFKLREISLTYNVPTSLMGKTFKGASISLIARNVLYFAMDENNHNDLDLDQFPGMTGYSALQTPTSRRYGVNINLVF